MAVVGTGASAYQVVPSIVDRVASLTVFQRTPPWMAPTPTYHEPLPAPARALATARLMTLTGAGGSGKSRLARELARRRSGELGDVWLVELALLADPALVTSATAAAMGVAYAGDGPAALAETLGDRQALIILDNCEHLRGACAELASALVRACPRVTVLATSREPLQIDG